MEGLSLCVAPSLSVTLPFKSINRSSFSQLFLKKAMMNGFSSAHTISLNHQHHRTWNLSKCFHWLIEKPTAKSTSAPAQEWTGNPRKQTQARDWTSLIWCIITPWVKEPRLQGQQSEHLGRAQETDYLSYPGSVFDYNSILTHKSETCQERAYEASNKL